jgi:hypothetical protein
MTDLHWQGMPPLPIPLSIAPQPRDSAPDPEAVEIVARSVPWAGQARIEGVRIT